MAAKVLYNHKGMRVVRFWDKGPKLRIDSEEKEGESIELTQEQLKDVFPVLQGFVGSVFSDESVMS